MIGGGGRFFPRNPFRIKRHFSCRWASKFFFSIPPPQIINGRPLTISNPLYITEALDDSPLLPADYRTKANALRAHFYPIEIDPSLTIEQKIPLMVEWWTGGHNLLIEHRCLNRNKLREIVAGAKLYLRLV